MDVGQRFKTDNDGDLIVEKYASSKEVHYRFVDTGFFGVTQAGNIRRGAVKDKIRPRVFGVGFVGVGHYTQTKNKWHYNMWKGMLERCYSEKYHEKFPTYIGCSVCDEWHNFQLFSLWLDRNIGDLTGRIELDKDIKIDGNKEYSPSACKLVKSAENNEKARAKSWSLISPEGEVVKIYNLSKFCKEKGLQYSNMHRVAVGERKTCSGWKLNGI